MVACLGLPTYQADFKAGHQVAARKPRCSCIVTIGLEFNPITEN